MVFLHFIAYSADKNALYSTLSPPGLLTNVMHPNSAKLHITTPQFYTLHHGPAGYYHHIDNIISTTSRHFNMGFAKSISCLLSAT